MDDPGHYSTQKKKLLQRVIALRREMTQVISLRKEMTHGSFCREGSFLCITPALLETCYLSIFCVLSKNQSTPRFTWLLDKIDFYGSIITYLGVWYNHYGITINILLTYYHIMLHFDALKIYGCGKHCEKSRNCLQQAISPVFTIFSTTQCCILTH